MKKSFVFALLAVSSMFSLLVPGCQAGEPAPEPNLGFKGESCEQRADCAAGLACMNKKCVAGSIAVTPTAKECVVECSADLDCCPAPDSSLCEDLLHFCQQFGDTDACDQYAQSCGPAHCKGWTCDPKELQCKFTHICQSNDECASGSCANGQCVECQTNEQCGEGNTCNGDKCQVACTLDSDCGAFGRCQGNVCVEGKCATDRECKAATRNALATCEAGECVEPCQTDLECTSPEEWNFQACVNGTCAYVGCETDKECQFFFSKSGVPSKDDTNIKCRDKK